MGTGVFGYYENDPAAVAAAHAQVDALRANEQSSTLLAEQERLDLAAAGEHTRLELDMNKMRALGDRMRAEGKPFLSNEDIEEMARELEAQRRTRPQRLQDGQQASTGNLDEERLSAAGVLVAAEARMSMSPEVIERSSVSPGIRSADSDESELGAQNTTDRRFPGGARSLSTNEEYNRPITSNTDDEARQELIRRAKDASMNLSDTGDMLAAGRLKDRIEHNASIQEIAGALLELEAAKRAEDIHLRLRNGKEIDVVNDGATTTVTVSDSGQSQSYTVSPEDVLTPMTSSSSSGKSVAGRMVEGLAGAVVAGSIMDLPNSNSTVLGAAGTMLAMLPPSNDGQNRSQSLDFA